MPKSLSVSILAALERIFVFHFSRFAAQENNTEGHPFRLLEVIGWPPQPGFP